MDEKNGKTRLYLNCQMGAAGDMLLAALYDLLGEDEKQHFICGLEGCGLPEFRAVFREEKRNGLAGIHFLACFDGEAEETADSFSAASTEHASAFGDSIGLCCQPHSQLDSCDDAHPHSHQHPTLHSHSHLDSRDDAHSYSHQHRGAAEVLGLVRALRLPSWVREQVEAVYLRLAAAEAEAHGIMEGLEHIHFHEVGSLDALADIAGFMLALDLLGRPLVSSSALNVGGGLVRSAHGLLPVPVPAVLALAQGAPLYGSGIEMELLTPTGMAILAQVVAEYGPMPALIIEAHGRGLGGRDVPGRWNGVHAILGQSPEKRQDAVQFALEGPNATATELQVNLDDMTAEAIGHLCDELYREGALELFLSPCCMKKNRLAQILTLLCRPEEANRLAAIILRQSSSFGLRRHELSRYELSRSMREITFEGHRLRVKYGQGYGVHKKKLEYDDCAAYARAVQISLDEARSKLEKQLETIPE